MHDANERQVEANTTRQQAETVRVLVEIGFDKEAALKAVTSNDLTALTT